MITLEEMSMLTTLYTQPHRHYHNINHINECLVELENFYAKEFSYGDRRIVEKAIWYHDAVYNPYSKENEINSACLVSYEGLEPSEWGQVIRAIHATAKHTGTLPVRSPENPKGIEFTTQVMLDIDLAGFGKPTQECLMNGINVRREYYKTSDYDFAVGRLKFLQTIGQRESLYYTDYFKAKYHEQSQKNLSVEIQIANDMIEQLGGK